MFVLTFYGCKKGKETVQTQLFYCCAVKMWARCWNQTEGERYMVLLVIVAQNREWPCLLFSGVSGVPRQLKCLFVSSCKLQRWLSCFFQSPGADVTHTTVFFLFLTSLFMCNVFIYWFYFLPLKITYKKI